MNTAEALLSLLPPALAGDLRDTFAEPLEYDVRHQLRQKTRKPRLTRRQFERLTTS